MKYVFCILLALIVLMPNATPTGYQYLKNRQQQRQIARSIELQQSRERTRRAIAKIGRRSVVRTRGRQSRRRATRGR